jgi:protein-disulfide isomerase
MPHDSITDAADRGRIRGSASAPLWVIVVSDFQCPFCKQWHDETYPALDSEYVRTGKVRLAYINLPLRMHQWAKPAAEAAMCASVQGKFWAMQDALFASQNQWEQTTDAPARFDSLAARTGVDMPRWRSCVAQHQTLPLIQADADRASTAGVQSTPSFFIGDEAVEGAQPLALFRQVIDRQLAKAVAKPAPSTPPAR